MKNIRCLAKSVKSQGILFRFRKTCCKTIDFDTVRAACAEAFGFGQWFLFFLYCYLPRLRSGKIVESRVSEESVKSQGTFKFLMSGNPGI